jgi:hypothetical protein
MGRNIYCKYVSIQGAPLGVYHAYDETHNSAAFNGNQAYRVVISNEVGDLLPAKGFFFEALSFDLAEPIQMLH